MRWVVAVFGALVAALFAFASPANATVQVSIDLSTQTMHVASSSGSYDWAISSARSGYYTPTGNFTARHLERMHHSRKYDNAPMPHSIFFAGGFAIHGTNHIGSLGRPASHGCIRLAPGNAAALYRMVAAEGAAISISGAAPSTPIYAEHHAKGHKTRYAKAHTRSRRIIEEQPEPAPETMYGLFGGF